MRLQALALFALTVVTVSAQTQTTLIPQFRDDATLKNHGVAISLAQSPAFAQALSKAAITPAAQPVQNGAVLTNLSGKNIVHIRVRALRVRRDTGGTVSADTAWGTNSLEAAIHPNGQVFVLPGIGVANIARTGDIQHVTSSAQSSRYSQIFSSTYFSTSYYFVDSVQFDDGTVIGPDTYGFVDEQKARIQVLADLRTEAYDSTLSDDQFKAELAATLKSSNPNTRLGLSGAVVDHLAAQRFALSDLTLGAMKQYGRTGTQTMLDRLLTFHNQLVPVKEN